jgi:hypothetical protein
LNDLIALAPVSGRNPPRDGVGKLAIRDDHWRRLAAIGAKRLLRKQGNPELVALLALCSLALEYVPQGGEAVEGVARFHYPLRLFDAMPQ